MPHANLEHEIRNIYGEIQTELALALRPGRFGFKPLNSPPRCRPKLMTIGYQPSGRQRDWDTEQASETHLRWPDRGEFEFQGGQGWKLAERMREIFPIGEFDYLGGYVGTNAIWIREGSEQEYREHYTQEERDHFEAVSRRGVERFVELMEPQRILFIGLKARDVFGTPVAQEAGPIQSGSVAGRPALACWHLSGTPMTGGEDGQRMAITSRLREWMRGVV